MSIQKLTIENQGSTGIKKTIDEKSMKIVLNMVQTFNYSKPIPSTVRELASNAVDAQREKEIALEILTGKKKIEDYFIEKKGEEFEDSKFDLSYYSPEFLDIDNNDVVITYKENDGMGFADTFTVRDNGVGISPSRLEGILRLGYSSKRNSKELMGGFGLGGKAPLATMTPFYTTITCYNGMLFKLNVFADKAESLIGKFNEETGDLNESVTFKNGAVVYYEKSTSKNYTEIVVPVKKLNKQKYIDAVESQLLYLPGIKFFVEDIDGYRREIDFKAKILYESENIVISRNSQYSRPHLILVKDKESNYGVCYNEINYKELELEQRYGAVALKVQSKATTKDDDDNEVVINEGVTVTPNREDIVWNDDTKKYLLNITKNVTKEAAEIVQKQLTEEDFLRWLGKCSTVLSNVSYGSVLHEISKMIDKDSIKPAYPKDKLIKFENPERMFWGMNVRVVAQYQSYKSGSKVEITRAAVEHWSNIINRPIYLQAENTSNVKDRFLTQDGAFVTMQVLDADDMLEKMLGELKLKGTTTELIKDAEDKFWEKVAKRDKILKFISESADVKNYDTVEVPADFATATETIIAAEEAGKEIVTADYRKLQGLVVIQTPRAEVVGWHTELVWEVHEVKAVDLPTLATRIYYGFDEDKDKIRAACRVLGSSAASWYNKDVAVIKVSRKLEKIICKHAEHVSKFFFNVSETNVITMSPEVVKYQTAKIIALRLTKQFEFLQNFNCINPEMHAMFHYLKNYKKQYYDNALRLRSEEKFAVESEMSNLLVKCAEFQQFVRTEDDAQLVADKSKELFGISGLVNAQTVDLKEIERMTLLTEYASEIHPLFNLIPALTEEYRYHPKEVDQQAIKLMEIVIKAKGLDQFEIPEELRLQEETITNEEE